MPLTQTFQENCNYGLCGKPKVAGTIMHCAENVEDRHGYCGVLVVWSKHVSLSLQYIATYSTRNLLQQHFINTIIPTRGLIFPCDPHNWYPMVRVRPNKVYHKQWLIRVALLSLSAPLKKNVKPRSFFEMF